MQQSASSPRLQQPSGHAGVAMESNTPAKGLNFDGRVLFLSQHAAGVRRQLEGDYLTLEQALPLRDDVSTGDIAPSGSLKRGGFAVAVAGHHYGKCASRERGPHEERQAGIRLVIARSF